jgi:hypothetical protein
MIDWKYEEFYEWYKNNFGNLEDDGTLMKLIHLKRYNRKYKLESFIHDKKEVIVRKVNGLKTVIDDTTKFPLGMYVLFNQRQRDEELMRLYFVFPSYKSSAEDLNQKVELIADHYSFSLSRDKGDKKPVKAHLTYYVPYVGKIDKGFMQHEDSYISAKLKVPFDGYDKHIFSNFSNLMNNAAMDIIRKPYITPSISGGAPPLKLTKKTKSHTISSRIARLLLKHNVVEVKAIGIKLKDMTKYTYTTFITVERDDEDTDDSVDYKQPIPSFVFQENGTYKSFEEKLIKLMK